MTETCGDYGGQTDGDQPCGRAAGWGRDTDTGPCRDHKGRGRDTALDEDLIESITTPIAEGKSVNSAARMNGIPTSTFYNWLDRGESEPDSIYGELLERYVRARGLGEDYVYSTVWEIAEREGDLPTLMSILKQRYPDSWGEVDRGEQAGGVTVDLTEPDEYEIDPETLEVVNPP